MEFCRKNVWSDCEELLRRFQLTDSVRFDTFCTLWREMKFSHIFYGTLNHEKRPFSRLVLNLASRFLVPPFSFQIRVGALYLLFSLYRSQTASPPQQIRIALKDWEDLKRLEKDAADAQHFDVVYIFRQLESCKAFHFTAMPTLLSYGKKRKMERSSVQQEFMARACRPQEVINMDLLEELANVQQLYNELKKSSLSPSGASADSSLNLVRSNLVSELQCSVMEFHQWQQKNQNSENVEETEDGGEGTSSQQCSRRADLLASIKTKAYGQATEASKSRRHRQVELDVTSDTAGTASVWPRNKKPKLSLKARTNENVRLSGTFWEEAKATTDIRFLTSFESKQRKHRVYKKFKWT